MVLAILLAVLPLPSWAIERLFSNGFFPFVQGGLTGLSNLVPFALFDALAIAVIGWWIWCLGRDLRRYRRSTGGTWTGVFINCVSRTLTIAATLYVVFLITWGLNYRRAPLADRLLIDEEQLTADAAQRLVLLAVQEVNALYGRPTPRSALPGSAVDPTLPGGIRIELRKRSRSRTARPARPKRTLLDPYFSSAGVAGMTDPYFLETLVASDLLPIERPFVIAHEWASSGGLRRRGRGEFYRLADVCSRVATGPI